MSVQSNLLFIIPYRKAYSQYDLFDYPVEWYEDMTPGERILIRRYFSMNTRNSTTDFCDALGIELTNFSTHDLTKLPYSDLIEKLGTFVRETTEFSQGQFYQEDYQKVTALYSVASIIGDKILAFFQVDM